MQQKSNRKQVNIFLKILEKKYATYKAEMVQILDLCHQLFSPYGNYNWNYSMSLNSPELMQKLEQIKKKCAQEKRYCPENAKQVGESSFDTNPNIRDSYLRIRNLDISQLEPPEFIGLKPLIKEPIEVFEKGSKKGFFCF